MNVELINPFVDATKSAFTSMLMLEVGAQKPWFRTKEKPEGITSDVCSVIGLSGKARGSVSLGFSMDVARSLVARFVGESDGSKLAMEEIGDGVGELVNLIAGGAKATLSERMGADLSISVPTVFSGASLRTRPDAFPVLVIPFETELGAFHMEIALEVAKR